MLRSEELYGYQERRLLNWLRPLIVIDVRVMLPKETADVAELSIAFYPFRRLALCT